MGRSKSSERKEYEQLRDALAKKQEEVRRLQAQVAHLDSRPVATHTAGYGDEEDAVVKIQSVHRGRLSRRGGGSEDEQSSVESP